MNRRVLQAFPATSLHSFKTAALPSGRSGRLVRLQFSSFKTVAPGREGFSPGSRAQRAPPPCLVIPSAVVPPHGERATDTGARWSARSEARTYDRAPVSVVCSALPGTSAEGMTRLSTPATHRPAQDHRRSPLSPSRSAPAGGVNHVTAGSPITYGKAEAGGRESARETRASATRGRREARQELSAPPRGDCSQRRPGEQKLDHETIRDHHIEIFRNSAHLSLIESHIYRRLLS